MTDSPLNRAVAKLEAANLTSDELDSLSQAIVASFAATDDTVEGFALDAASPKGFSLNYEEIKVTLHAGLANPSGYYRYELTNYTDAGRVTSYTDAGRVTY